MYVCFFWGGVLLSHIPTCKHSPKSIALKTTKAEYTPQSSKPDKPNDSFTSVCITSLRTKERGWVGTAFTQSTKERQRKRKIEETKETVTITRTTTLHLFLPGRIYSARFRLCPKTGRNLIAHLLRDSLRGTTHIHTHWYRVLPVHTSPKTTHTGPKSHSAPLIPSAGANSTAKNIARKGVENMPAERQRSA